MSVVLIAAIIAAGAMASGISGFGFALLSVTLLSFFFDVKTAVVFLVLHVLTQNILQFINLRKYFDLRSVVPLLAGGMLGVPPGVLFLKSMDVELVQKVLGVVVLLFVLQSLLKERKSRREYQDMYGGFREPHKGMAGLFGVTGGMLMGAFLSGGPPIVMYAIQAGGSKYRIKATMQSFFLFSNIYSLALYIWSGLMTLEIALESIKYLPVTIAATLFGISLFKGMSVGVFNRMLYAFLALVGVMMLVK